MRLGDLLALRWSDVDLADEPTIQINGSLHRSRGQLQILEPNTPRSVRMIAIGTSWTDLGLVFPNHWGNYMNPEWFRRRKFYGLLQRAGIRKIRIHDLRHTFATLQIANYQPVKIVSEMTGQTRTVITQDLYTHVSAAMPRSAADALNRVLKSRRPATECRAKSNLIREMPRSPRRSSRDPLTAHADLRWVARPAMIMQEASS